MTSDLKNHIRAKFLNIDFSPITPEKFASLSSELIEALRPMLPRYDKVEIRDIDVISKSEISKEIRVHMVDAEGLWGAKITDNSLALSVSEYITYEEAVDFAGKVIMRASDVLNITHFSNVSLRNINLFDQENNKTNAFVDVKENLYWGAHEFPTLLGDKFACTGAATRHEYFSSDFLQHIRINSGAVMGAGHSYIPHDEWDIWRLRGEIPTVTGTDNKLMIDIIGNRLESPANAPGKSGNVTAFNWNVMKNRFDELHDLVNRVYADIID